MTLARRGAMFGQLQHGLSRTPEYRAWQLIRLRCLDPKHAAYPNYGGRGITMHEAWVSDPAAFIAHVGKRPSSKHEIDRINNDRGYQPGNLRWVTRKVNSRNRRSSTAIEYRGKTASIVEWCERLSLPYSTILKRFNDGWATDLALETPVKYKSPNGTEPELTASQIADLAKLLDGGRHRVSGFAGTDEVNVRTAKALVRRDLARWVSDVELEITDAGRARYQGRRAA